MTFLGAAPRVTVVIPTCNRAAFLPSAVSSALQQTVTDLEVVVVDDGSTDSTRAACSDLARADARVRVLVQEHRGPSAARNTGIAAARGEWVAFLDDDDLWVPHALATLLAATSSAAEAVACLSWRFFSDNPNLQWDTILREPVRFHLEPWPPGSPPDPAHLGELLLRPLAPIHAGLFRTATLQGMGGFDERRWAAEDYELWLRLALRGPIRVVGQRLALYRWHPQQASAALGRQARETREALERFLASHPEGWAAAGRARLRQRLAFLCREECYAALLVGDAATARRAALASVRLWPLAWKSWGYLALAPAPRLYRALRRAARPAGEASRR